MEPTGLLKAIGELAILLKAGGEHVYAATYESVVVSAWRDIFIFAGLTAFCIIVAIVLFWLSRRFGDGLGYEPACLTFAIVTTLGIPICAVLLGSRIADLYRLDFLTIEALKALVR